MNKLVIRCYLDEWRDFEKQLLGYAYRHISKPLSYKVMENKEIKNCPLASQ